MAGEAKVIVRVDVDEAKRSMDQVNDRMAKTKSLGQDLAKSVRNIANGAAAGIAVVGGIAEGAGGGGVLSALAGNATDAASAGYRRIFEHLGLAPDALAAGAAYRRSFDRAVSDVQNMVGAGGNIDDDDIESMIRDLDRLYQPGEKNRQRVAMIGQNIRADDVSAEINGSFGELMRKAENILQNFDNAIGNLVSLLGG